VAATISTSRKEAGDRGTNICKEDCAFFSLELSLCYKIKNIIAIFKIILVVIVSIFSIIVVA
jgi:hypothetical protein